MADASTVLDVLERAGSLAERLLPVFKVLRENGPADENMLIKLDGAQVVLADLVRLMDGDYAGLPPELAERAAAAQEYLLGLEVSTLEVRRILEA